MEIHQKKTNPRVKGTLRIKLATLGAGVNTDTTTAQHGFFMYN